VKTSSRRRRILLAVAVAAAAAVLAVVAVAAGATSPTHRARAHAAAAVVPPVRHVWIVELENETATNTFGHPAADPYLARTLVHEGAFLPNYYGIGHDSLDNYIAEVSGQAPNFQTGQDCEYFTRFFAFEGETFDRFTRDGQLSGDGCVYPPVIKTVGNQLTAHGRSWKAYEEDMGIDPRRDGTAATASGPACGHPALNAIDLTDTTGPANDSYATRHDPFVYFRSVIGNQRYCDAHVVTLAALASDLRGAATTPSYSFITPNTCHDAHDTPRCQDGERGGMVQADRFLRRWVPRIMASPAYRQGGLIAIVFDESGDDTQAGACCGEKLSLGYTDPSHPNANEPGLFGPGGGRTGAVLISPFIRPGTVTGTPYNHYSLLRSVEGIFGLPYLGDARQPGVTAFGADVWTNLAASASR
jgi:phosphatidylinositol-3-phosphatase